MINLSNSFIFCDLDNYDNLTFKLSINLGFENILAMVCKIYYDDKFDTEYVMSKIYEYKENLISKKINKNATILITNEKKNCEKNLSVAKFNKKSERGRKTKKNATIHTRSKIENSVKNLSVAKFKKAKRGRKPKNYKKMGDSLDILERLISPIESTNEFGNYFKI